jgi:hypothetical protein
MNRYDVVGQYGMGGFPSAGSTRSNGTTYYVDGNAGGAGNSGASGQGLSWTTPFSTINYAVSQCSNNGGDVILVAENHTETIADTSPTNASGSVTDELCIDKEGVTIIGMGRGTTRPTLSLATNTDATVEIRAADVAFKNFIVVSALADQAVGITIANAADGILIEDCEIRDGGTNVLELVLGISISASSDDVTIRGCKFVTTAGGSGTLSAIKTVGAASRLEIYDNIFLGDWNAQVMDLDAAKITDLVIRDNIINSLDSAGIAIDTHSTSTGVIVDNVIHVGSEANAIIAAACLVGPNYISIKEGDLGGLSNPSTSYTATKTYTNWTAARHTLFNVEGGPVRINYIVGIVMATIKAASIDISLDVDTDDPGGDLEIASVLAIDGDAVGTMYTLNATPAGALVATTIGAIVDTTDPILMNIGDICFTGVGAEDGGGSIQWSVNYTPLHPGAYIVPAATD